MSVHTHPKERQREPLIVVGFKIVEITLKTAIEACYIVAAIGKDFSYFLAPPSLSTIDYDSSICGHGFEHMGQRVEWCIDGTFDRVGGEVGSLKSSSVTVFGSSLANSAGVMRRYDASLLSSSSTALCKAIGMFFPSRSDLGTPQGGAPHSSKSRRPAEYSWPDQ